MAIHARSMTCLCSVGVRRELGHDAELLDRRLVVGRRDADVASGGAFAGGGGGATARLLDGDDALEVARLVRVLRCRSGTDWSAPSALA